jgi:hypothetical protein
MALDIVTNNFDRFPLIWNNNGNIANVIIQSSESDGRVVGIDNNCTCIKTHFENYSKYLAKVKDLVGLLIQDSTKECPGIALVRLDIASGHHPAH